MDLAHKYPFYIPLPSSMAGRPALPPRSAQVLVDALEGTPARFQFDPTGQLRACLASIKTSLKVVGVFGRYR